MKEYDMHGQRHCYGEMAKIISVLSKPLYKNSWWHLWDHNVRYCMFRWFPIKVLVLPFPSEMTTTVAAFHQFMEMCRHLPLEELRIVIPYDHMTYHGKLDFSKVWIQSLEEIQQFNLSNVLEFNHSQRYHSFFFLN